INRESDNHHDAYEADLKYSFLNVEAEIALHHHFHQQHQDHAAIQNRNGQEIKDGEVEADHAHQLEKLGRTLASRGASHSADTYRPGEVLWRHAPFQHTFKELHDQEGALAV